MTTLPSILTDRVLPSRWSLIARIVRLRRDRPHARSGLDPLPGAALAASQRADDASLSLLLPVTQMACRSHASAAGSEPLRGGARCGMWSGGALMAARRLTRSATSACLNDLLCPARRMSSESAETGVGIPQQPDHGERVSAAAVEALECVRVEGDEQRGRERGIGSAGRRSACVP